MRRLALTPVARGFSLIEQLVVITAVGTTSAVALPRFIEIQAQAETTALLSLAAAASSAMMLNQAGCLVTDHRASAGRCAPVADCADAAALLMADLPAGYRIEAQAIAPQGGRANGNQADCRMLQADSGASAVFTGLSAAQAL